VRKLARLIPSSFSIATSMSSNHMYSLRFKLMYRYGSDFSKPIVQMITASQPSELALVLGLTAEHRITSRAVQSSCATNNPRNVSPDSSVKP